MSHVATIDIEITDLDALAEACRPLGLEFVRGQTTYRWWGRHMGDYPLPEGFAIKDLGRCAHAIRMPPESEAYQRARDLYGEPPYEIGVVPRRDGRPGYTLMWDFLCGGMGLEAAVGKDCGLLKQQYARRQAITQAQRLGFQVSEQQRADGSLQLVFNR